MLSLNIVSHDFAISQVFGLKVSSDLWSSKCGRTHIKIFADSCMVKSILDQVEKMNEMVE